MTISVGERVPAATLQHLSDDGLEDVSTETLFRGKKVVVFGLPGAFTPICSARHVPGYLAQADAFKAKGVDTIACVSVNDAYVMDAWGKQQCVDDRILMLADGSGTFTAALGLILDLGLHGLGLRSQRYAMIVEDGVVKSLDVEPDAGRVQVSMADGMLAKL